MVLYIDIYVYIYHVYIYIYIWDISYTIYVGYTYMGYTTHTYIEMGDIILYIYGISIHIYRSAVCFFHSLLGHGHYSVLHAQVLDVFNYPLTMSTCRILFRIFSPEPWLLGAFCVSGRV